MQHTAQAGVSSADFLCSNTRKFRRERGEAERNNGAVNVHHL